MCIINLGKLDKQECCSKINKCCSYLTKYVMYMFSQQGKVKNIVLDLQSRWEKEDLKKKLLDFLEKDRRSSITPE